MIFFSKNIADKSDILVTVRLGLGLYYLLNKIPYFYALYDVLLFLLDIFVIITARMLFR